MNMNQQEERNALLSVFDKTGIVAFARALITLGFRIISSGGTARYLMDAGVRVTSVYEITGLEAVLDHRVVTLAEEIHGGLLATEKHRKELMDLDWPWIDLACVDLYPIAQAIAAPNATPDSVAEMTDIGGPTMLRSAAKGRRIVACRSEQRGELLEWLRAGEPNPEQMRINMAWLVEETISNYCGASADFLRRFADPDFLKRFDKAA